MDKYEFNIKVEQIKKLVNKGDYETAMKIADTIDWRRIRSASLLSMVAEVYESNHEYQEAKEILLLAFERAPVGKRLLYKLAELALKEGNVKEAEDYYREFCDLAPEDPRQYLLRYLILKNKKASEEQLIHSLEQYTNTELDEKWLYELAELYCRAGRKEACVGTCDKIMLMFGLGSYVDKAMELKVQYAPLSGYQIDLIENRDKYEERLRAVEQEFSSDPGRMIEDDYDEIEQDAEYGEEIGQQEEEASYRTIDEDMAAGFHQAEAEERLAQAVSQFSEEDFSGSGSEMENTKIIRNIRDVAPVFPKLPKEDAVESSIVVEDAPDGSMVDPEVSHMMESEENGAADTEPAEIPVSDGDGVVLESAVSAEPETVEAEEEEPAAENPDTDGTCNGNHLMIEARMPEKGLEIAIEALKQFRRDGGSKNPVIKINGEKLSARGVLASSDKISGRDLVIEEAGDLSAEALQELYEFMLQDQTGMRVILIDNPRQMESICQASPGIASMFTLVDEDGDHEFGVKIQSEIPTAAAETVSEAAAVKDTPLKTTASTEAEAPQLASAEIAATETAATAAERSVPAQHTAPHPILTSSAARPVSRSAETETEEEMELREFVDYARRYAANIDCSINGKSMLALHERIEIMEEDGVPLTKANAEDLIEAAADKAEKFSFKRLFFSKYDREGLLILREEHFLKRVR